MFFSIEYCILCDPKTDEVYLTSWKVSLAHFQGVKGATNIKMGMDGKFQSRGLM